MRTERSEVRTKKTEGPIFPSTARASSVSKFWLKILNLSIGLHLLKPLFLLAPFNLHLYCFLEVFFCFIFRSFVPSANGVRRCKCAGPPEFVGFAPKQKYTNWTVSTETVPQSVLQNPDRGRTNQSARICLRLALSYNKYVLFTGREVRIGKNCARGLEYGPKPQAEGRTRDRGHSFSQYGPTKAGE